MGMFAFYEGVPTALVLLVWLCVFVSLFALNEVTRRFKWVGFSAFVILPVVLTILWLTAFKDTAYMDWFHLAKVYSSTAGCIGFWCIRHVKKLSSNRIALCFPPLILAVNICEAVLRDFEIGRYVTPVMEYTNNQTQYYIGGAWNYMNGIAGILNIITITGWFGICIRAVTKKDGSKDMLWPDMMWFWIVAYDLWNFAYTYNCLPTHAWYCGFALLLAPTVCAFTVGKGAWLQHRAHTRWHCGVCSPRPCLLSRTPAGGWYIPHPAKPLQMPRFPRGMWRRTVIPRWWSRAFTSLRQQIPTQRHCLL